MKPRFACWLRRARALPLVAALASPRLSAQVAAPPSPAAKAEADNNIIELSPFETRENTEDKWNAASTLLGNRTDQELIKVPVTVDVLTRDFMNDIGVFDQDDAGAFIAGVTESPRLESRNESGRLTFRGLSSGGTTSRNFFQWSVPSDNYNVERYDFGKGSNSLMFGDSAPGGQVTTTTKRAQFRNFAEVFGYYDSLDSHRVQLDVNRKLSSQLALRLNTVHRTEKSWVDGSFQQFEAVDLATTYRPFKNTTVTLDAERGTYKRRRADNTAAILPVAAPGRGFSTNNRWYVTSDGEIIQRPSAAVPTIDTTAASGNAVSLLEGQSVAVRLPNGTSKVFHGFSRSFNILGFGDYLDRPFNVVTAVVEQNIGKLSIEASYNQQFQHQDRNDNSFGGSASPPTISVDSRGRPFLDLSGNLTAWKVFGDIFKAGRLSVAYPFEFGKWMRQYVVLTATRSRDYAFSRRFGWSNLAAPGLAANNGIQLRAYLDDPVFLESGGWNQFLFKNLPRTPTFQPALVESYVNTGPFIDVRYTRNYTASVTGEYFGGRLTSLIGVSNNRISRKIPVDAAYATDARGLITFYGTPENSPSFFTYDPSFSLSANSFTAGLNYELFNRENVHVIPYVNYLQSFNWQSQQIFTGRSLGPITGTTREIGLKGDFWQRRISYSIGVYEIQRQNAGYAWSPNSLTQAQLEDLFNPNDILPADPRYFHVDSGLNNESHEVNSQEKSRGYDITVFSQRVHGLQSRLTFSQTRVEATRDFSDFNALLDAAIARTNAANAPGGNKAMAESASLIATAITIRDANTNVTAVTGRRSAPYTASAALDYQLPQPTGLRVGLTAVWTPNYNVATLNNITYTAGQSCPIGVYAIYDRRVFKLPVSIRAGVTHLYDLLQGRSLYYKSGANTVDATTGRPNYIDRYTEPLTTNLSVTVRL